MAKTSLLTDMDIIEKIINLVAPHRCIICGIPGELICSACRTMYLEAVPSRCYRCHKLTRQSSVCVSCRSSVKLAHVWVAVEYEGVSKELLHKLKFERAKAGSEAIAEILSEILPALPPEVIITHVPTAGNRVRQRGYDQSRLIAGNISVRRKWRRQTLIIRKGSSRQVGASRKERFKHLEKALAIKKNVDIRGKHILLIDDVTTTGATIEAAAKVLKDAGAKTVDAAVFAQPS